MLGARLAAAGGMRPQARKFHGARKLGADIVPIQMPGAVCPLLPHQLPHRALADIAVVQKFCRRTAVLAQQGQQQMPGVRAGKALLARQLYGGFERTPRRAGKIFIKKQHHCLSSAQRPFTRRCHVQYRHTGGA